MSPKRLHEQRERPYGRQDSPEHRRSGRVRAVTGVTQGIGRDAVLAKIVELGATPPS